MGLLSKLLGNRSDKKGSVTSNRNVEVLQKYNRVKRTPHVSTTERDLMRQMHDEGKTGLDPCHWTDRVRRVWPGNSWFGAVISSPSNSFGGRYPRAECSRFTL